MLALVACGFNAWCLGFVLVCWACFDSGLCLFINSVVNCVSCMHICLFSLCGLLLG